MQPAAGVLSIAAILTLALPAAADGLRALERLPLPASAGAAAVRAEPLASRVVLAAPRSAPAVARALRALGSSICPEVEERGDEVRLGCRTTRLAAALVPLGRGPALELRELAGLPVAGEDGFPVLPFATEAIGLGECPGATPAARGECLLRAGDRAGARQAFAEAAGLEARGVAALRLGDLAALDGNLRAAEVHWLQVAEEPWKRLASARACEVSDCAVDDAAEAAFRLEGLAPPLLADVAVRGARALAFRGRPLDGAARLLALPDACGAVQLLCHRILLAALRGPPPQSDGAVGLYLSLPDRDRSPVALDLGLLAAARLAEMGAPTFAANLMASVGGLVPARDEPAHLLRTAELYLAAGDAVRAGVVLDYARQHLGKAAVRSSRWSAVARAAASRRRKAEAARPAAAPPEIGSAAQALARAREVVLEEER
ncbi:MAG TPA: hypothetical protein VH880_10035 [Anaeromyxobacteraceae bacterium]